MKKFNFIFIVFALFLGFASAKAQENVTPEKKPDSARPNLLRELNLTADQIQQIRNINQANRSLLIEAQRRHREAIRLLDEAVYNENLNENSVAEKLKNLEAAQSQLSKIKTNTELSIRKVLTSEQLVKFRELREQLRMRKEMFNRREDRRIKPIRESRPLQKNRRFSN